MTSVGDHMPSGPSVRVEGVNHYYGEAETRNQVLFNNSLEIGGGQLVVMTGPSGSGKTTLISLIGGLRSVQEGAVAILGHKLGGLSRHQLVQIRRNLGFIFQAHNLFESLSAYENVKMAMQLSSCPPDEMRARGMRMLERLGIANRADYKPRALSGGQRQRVAVARALVNRPKLVLADEPTASLDKDSSATVVSLLKELTLEEGCCVLMVTHDNRILDLADRIVNMVDGHIASDVVLREAIKICEFLKNVDLFKNLTPSEMTSVADQMKKRNYPRSQTVIRQGDVGEEFFVIAKGTASVHVKQLGEPERQLATLVSGDVFGEMALLTDEPRNATVRAIEDMETYYLNKKDFQQALQLSMGFRDQIRQTYFDRYHLLRTSSA